MKITIQEDRNIHIYSLFCLFVLAVENSRNVLNPLVTCNVLIRIDTYRNQVFIFLFLTKEKKRKKE